jgi:hypothetical protein
MIQKQENTMEKFSRTEITAKIAEIAPGEVRFLPAKTVDELHLLYYKLLVQKTLEENEQREEREIQQRAKDAAWLVTQSILYRQAEQKKADAFEPQDRAIFEQVARKTEKFSCIEANFVLARRHLTPGFTALQLQDAYESGALMLSPPSQAEIQQWHAEEAELLAPVVVDAQRNWSEDKYGREQMLRKVRELPIDNLRERVRVIEENRRLASMSTEDLKKHAAGQRTEQRTQVVQQSHGHRPVPPDITAEVLKKADASRLRDLVRLYGSAALTEILKQR